MVVKYRKIRITQYKKNKLLKILLLSQTSNNNCKNISYYNKNFFPDNPNY